VIQAKKQIPFGDDRKKGKGSGALEGEAGDFGGAVEAER
jgi:hypothetical protein